MRCRAGVERADIMGDRLFFLTLTSSLKRGIKFLAVDWDLLVKRVRRELRFKFEFFKIITCEGNGVIHAIFRCSKTDFSLYQGWSYEAIHAYFSCLWNELHFAPIVWVTECYKIGGNYKKLVRYLVSQYVIRQSFLHLGYSGGWCFKGFVKRFKDLIHRLGFKMALVAWRFLLTLEDIKLKKSFDLIIAPVESGLLW